jgi:tetratricopeptide (TPR) repeat protein
MLDKLLKAGRFDEAQRALESNRASITEAKYHFFRGVIAYNQGQIALAESFLAAAYAAKKTADTADALRLILQTKGEHSKALPYAEYVFNERGKQRKDLMPYLTCLLDSGKIEDAEAIVDREMENYKDDSKLVQAKASCLRQRGDRTEALKLVDRQLTITPEDPSLLRVKADIVGEVSSEAAIQIYDRAMELAVGKDPRSLSPMKWNMSLHLLRTRDFKRGWEYYESGLTPEVGTMGRALHPLVRAIPRYDDRTASGDRWTVMTVEQGIGDQILFLTVLGEAVEEFKKVILLAEPRLIDLYARSFPSIQVLAPGVVESLADCQIPHNGLIPIGSLMQRYRPSVESFIKNRRPFLRVHKQKFEKYKGALKEQAGERPIIGISWKGGYWENQQRNKTIVLKDWLPLLRKKALFVNLQYGEVEDEIAELSSLGIEFLRFPKLDFKVDLDDWLSIAAACDGIVSVSTALVHFAGACNQRVAMLMPERQGPYIWGVSDQRSICYPNVHIFRRLGEESIESLMLRIAEQVL